jgi:hypothetical protein
VRTIIHAGRGHRIYRRGDFIHQPKPPVIEVPDGEETETETAVTRAGSTKAETAAAATVEK